MPRSASKFGEDRIMRAGCSCENVVFFYRQDAAKPQTADIKFTHRPKIRFFVPHYAPIQVKLGRADWQSSLGDPKFHLYQRRGWECDPREIK